MRSNLIIFNDILWICTKKLEAQTINGDKIENPNDLWDEVGQTDEIITKKNSEKTSIKIHIGERNLKITVFKTLPSHK